MKTVRRKTKIQDEIISVAKKKKSQTKQNHDASDSP